MVIKIMKITIMITSRSGASVNLECRANGNPSPAGFLSYEIKVDNDYDKREKQS